MPRLTTRQQRWLKLLHLVCVSCWTGGALSLALLYFPRQMAKSGGELVGLATAVHWVDMGIVVIPGAFGCLLTGLLYSLFTDWGFFRHGWIIFKWIMTLGMITFGMTCLGVWENGLLDLAARYGLEVVRIRDYLIMEWLHFGFGTLQALALVGVVAVSVFKPWRKPRRSTGAGETRA